MLTATGLELRAGARLLLDAATFRVAAGDRVGLVGRNGAGKTTLCKVLAGEGIPAAGDSKEAEPRLLARDGLMHLGYTLTEAESLLEGTEGSSAEELINAALRRSAEGTGTRS